METRLSKTAAQRTSKAFTLVVACLMAMLLAMAFAPGQAQAVKTYKQSGEALQPYNVKDFKVLKNKNYGQLKVTSFDTPASTYETVGHTYKKKKGNKAATLKTWLYLPVTYERSGDMGNPQSINITPDGKFAYVVYPQKKNSTTCRIVRYDLAKLATFGLDKTDMDRLSQAAKSHFYGNSTEEQLELLSCITFGPWIKNFGHGAAVALNPKDKCLWFTSATGKSKTNLQRINMKTLKPDLKINFKMKSTVSMGNNLTFDNKGRCYFYSYSGGGWSPKGTIKIYRGTISKKNKVSFELIMQGIRYSPSTNIQSIGYNPKSNRIYLVSNGTVMSLPVNKLGKLKKNDVKVTVFSGKREYEGIAFDKKGNGYVLMNKMPELLKVSSGF